MAKVKIPRSYKGRLKTTGKANGYKGADDFGLHLIERGVRQYEGGDGDAPLGTRLDDVMDSMGYSSITELIEHLLERGLGAYETASTDPAKFEERLRGLGYID
jgi:hypothetical protein